MKKTVGILVVGTFLAFSGEVGVVSSYAADYNNPPKRVVNSQQQQIQEQQQQKLQKQQEQKVQKQKQEEQKQKIQKQQQQQKIQKQKQDEQKQKQLQNQQEQQKKLHQQQQQQYWQTPAYTSPVGMESPRPWFTHGIKDTCMEPFKADHLKASACIYTQKIISSTYHASASHPLDESGHHTGLCECFLSAYAA